MSRNMRYHKQSMIVAPQPEPTEAGADILREGGNAVDAAIEAGLRDVGENRIQEALKTMDSEHAAVRWHLIGHLQRNKAKHAARFDLVHSIDSARLADAVRDG